MASARHHQGRKRNRRRFGLLFKLLCAAALIAAVTLGATVFFQVESIVVAGNQRYTADEIVAASGVEVGDNLFLMNKNQISQQILRQLPYIGEVSPQRQLPSTLLVQVKELSAAAKVEVYLEGDPSEEERESEGEEADVEETEGAAAASEAWLISANGKLLEPASEDSEMLSVVGLTVLVPQAGTLIAVPQEQQYRLDALKELLAALGEMGQLEEVSSIDLTHSTWVGMRYRERFDVRLPLGEDFGHLLNVLSAAVDETIANRGEQASGTMDLTQKQLADAIFTPEESM